MSQDLARVIQYAVAEAIASASQGRTEAMAKESIKKEDMSIPYYTDTQGKFVGGGLFGDNTIPVSLPAMPKLAGTSARQYAEWKAKALTYFTVNSLTQVVMASPSKSLSYAIKMDGGMRSPTHIKSLWIRLNSRAYAVIKGATETVLGTGFYPQNKKGVNYIEEEMKVADMPIEEMDIYFKEGSSNYLWESIERKLERYTENDMVDLVTRYMSFKYAAGTDPDEGKRNFETIVYDLELADMNIDPKMHKAIWIKALPPELESLRQGLNSRKINSWEEVFEALKQEYATKKGRKQVQSGKLPEHAHAAVDARPGNGRRPRRGEGKERAFNKGDKFKRYCTFCEKPGHTKEICSYLKNAKAALAQPGGSTSDSEGAGGEHAAVAIEEEVAAMLQHDPEQTEAANLGKEEVAAPVHFIFDSGATTHVTPNAKLLDDITDTPVMTMSTAISGHRSLIKKRGQIRLNDNWTLRDVAFVPSASYNLISEGRLTDADYDIFKTKEFILVKKDGKTVLRGIRSNRLWIYTINGRNKRVRRPINTLVRTKDASQALLATSSAAAVDPSVNRTIPKCAPASTPAPGGVATQSSQRS
jgi:hypothetical protein